MLAYVQLRSGDTEGAANLAGSALDVLRGQQGTAFGATAHLVLAEVALTRGDTNVAAILQSAKEVLGDQPYDLSGPDREAARVWRELGDLYGRIGAGDEQMSAYRRALEAAGVRGAMVGVTVDPALVR